MLRGRHRRHPNMRLDVPWTASVCTRTKIGDADENISRKQIALLVLVARDLRLSAQLVVPPVGLPELIHEPLGILDGNRRCFPRKLLCEYRLTSRQGDYDLTHGLLHSGARRLRRRQSGQERSRPKPGHKRPRQWSRPGRPPRSTTNHSVSSSCPLFSSGAHRGARSPLTTYQTGLTAIPNRSVNLIL